MGSFPCRIDAIPTSRAIAVRTDESLIFIKPYGTRCNIKFPRQLCNSIGGGWFCGRHLIFSVAWLCQSLTLTQSLSLDGTPYVNVIHIVGEFLLKLSTPPSKAPMNSLESELTYPFGEALPDPGALKQVCSGVYWLRMPLPFALNHINLWLLEDGDGWTVIDCGIASDETRSSWKHIFAHHLNGKPVTRVIATHCHPDHLGLADWLCEQWQVPLWMSAGEYGFGRMMQAGLSGLDWASMVPHFRRNGVLDPQIIAQLSERKEYYSTLVPAIPTSFVRLQDQQMLRIGAYGWQVITGFGHSPEHVSLFCAELNCLISGDMVLPRISTNVSVWASEPLGNPLQMFLDSLARYDALDTDALILPSHGKPFRGLQIRLQQLMRHHQDRLAELLQACETPQSANDVLPVLFPRPLDAHQLTFAFGESLAHCHYLWYCGKLERVTGDDGIFRFVAKQQAQKAST